VYFVPLRSYWAISFRLDYLTVAERLAVLGATDPQTKNCYHSDHRKALSRPKTRRLCYRALTSVVWFGLWTYRTNTNYIYKAMLTLKVHTGVYFATTWKRQFSTDCNEIWHTDWCLLCNELCHAWFHVWCRSVTELGSGEQSDHQMNCGICLYLKVILNTALRCMPLWSIVLRCDR